MKLCFILCLFAGMTLYAKDPGITAFYKGDFEKARDYYEGRLGNKRENEKLLYNAGTAALGMQEGDAAGSLLRQSLSSPDPSLRAAALYNLGQLSLQNNNPSEALEYFKKSMIEDPADMNSKVMYERLRMLMQQQEQQEQQEDRHKEGEDCENPQKQDSGQDEGSEQDQEQDQSQHAPDAQRGEKEQQQAAPTELSEADLQPQDLSEEQVRNILNAMREKEMESMKKLILNKSNSKRIKRSKEW